jgi:hypothetical protein
MTTKTCTKCGLTLDLNEFYKDSRATDGKRSCCKECSKQYRRKNADKVLADNRAYYQENKEYFKRYMNEYFKTEKGKEVLRAERLKRAEFGYAPLNESDIGYHLHHLHLEGNHDFGIFIPEFIHRFGYHNSFTGYGMDTINAMAIQFWLNPEIYLEWEYENVPEYQDEE